MATTTSKATARGAQHRGGDSGSNPFDHNPGRGCTVGRSKQRVAQAALSVCARPPARRPRRAGGRHPPAVPLDYGLVSACACWAPGRVSNPARAIWDNRSRKKTQTTHPNAADGSAGTRRGRKSRTKFAENNDLFVLSSLDVRALSRVSPAMAMALYRDRSRPSWHAGNATPGTEPPPRCPRRRAWQHLGEPTARQRKCRAIPSLISGMSAFCKNHSRLSPTKT